MPTTTSWARIEIGNPWTRATPPTAPTGGGFLTITNKGTTPDRLIAVRSPASSKVELHEMKMDGNIMRMREIEKGIEIPPGATVELKPGGFHIMFMELKAPFAKDAKVPRHPGLREGRQHRRRAAGPAMGAGRPPARAKH